MCIGEPQKKWQCLCALCRLTCLTIPFFSEHCLYNKPTISQKSRFSALNAAYLSRHKWMDQRHILGGGQFCLRNVIKCWMLCPPVNGEWDPRPQHRIEQTLRMFLKEHPSPSPLNSSPLISFPLSVSLALCLLPWTKLRRQIDTCYCD